MLAHLRETENNIAETESSNKELDFLFKIIFANLKRENDFVSNVSARGRGFLTVKSTKLARVNKRYKGKIYCLREIFVYKTSGCVRVSSCKYTFRFNLFIKKDWYYYRTSTSYFLPACAL